MCSIMDIVNPIVGCFCEAAIGTVQTHGGYVYRYKKNLTDVEHEMEKLELHLGIIKGKVEEAETRGEIVEPNVVQWLEKTDNMKSEVDEFIRTTSNNENKHCFKCSCPNLISRYKISKLALQKTGNISGHIEGGKFDQVARRAPLPVLPSNDYMNFESRSPLLEKIKQKLATVDMIGVYGIGGVGKTAIVEEVGRQVKKEGLFDEVVVAVVSKDVDVRKIQGQIADRLNERLVSETEEGRAGELWNRLNNEKKNLVILDDLWEELKLITIGIPLRNRDKGCKVILTTRDHQVLEKMQVECFHVDTLSESEAWDLFKNKLGNTFDSATLQSEAELVCKECGGLPVAILAVAGALKGKDKHAWEDALNQLRNSSFLKIPGIDKKVYASLKWSYDALEKEERSCFLLCCLYPEDAEISIDVLVYQCMARGLLGTINDTVQKVRCRVLTLIDALKDRSLLLDGKNVAAVKIHDVIRDVALSIAKAEEGYLVNYGVKAWPLQHINENLTAISLGMENVEEVPDVLLCPKLHTLLLKCQDNSFKIPDNFFSGVKELQVLELKGISMLSIPSSLANLSKLRTLTLAHCRFEDISILKCLKNSLEVLILVYPSIEDLPPGLGELSRLRVLNLKRTYRFKIIPADTISKLTHLEELYLPRGVSFHEELSGMETEDVMENRAKCSVLSLLSKLTTLYIDLPDVAKVHELSFDGLFRYRVSVGGGSFMDYYYLPKTDKMLSINAMAYHEKLNTLMKRATALCLHSVDGLKKVLHDDREENAFLELKYLHMRHCHDLDHLIGNPKKYPSSAFSKLTEMHAINCSFRFMFSLSCAKILLQLKKLTIHDCKSLKEIVRTEGEKDEQEFKDTVCFSNLKELKLKNLPKLIRFWPKVEKDATIEEVSSRYALFNEKVNFPYLETLSIESIPNITEIWCKELHPTDSFSQLIKVTVSSCKKLVNVFPFNMYTRAQKLRSLTIEQCKGIEVVVSVNELEENESPNNGTSISSQLQNLSLTNLENLKSFCVSSRRYKLQCLFDPQVTLPSLETLLFENIPNITEIWGKELHPTDSFPQLITVTVSSCEKLVNVFPSNMYTRAKKLRSLTIKQCQGIEVVVSVTELEESESPNNGTSISSQLQYLSMTNLENLKSFYGSSRRPKSQCLFDPQVTFPSLETLSIESIPNITEIWCKELHPTDSFPQLIDVTVWSCEKLFNVFPSNTYTRAKNLRSLTVSKCKEIEVIVSVTELEEREPPNHYTIFSQLRKLDLFDLENLKSFYGSSRRSKSQCLFDPQVTFPYLEKLSIRSVPNITEIWCKELHPTNSFPQLIKVTVLSCEKLVNVFPSNMYANAKNLRRLTVGKCKEIEVVVSVTELEEREPPNNHTIIFSQLRKLYLFDLENLKNFCGSSKRSKLQCLFDPQVTFPALEDITIGGFPSMTEIWDISTESFPPLASVWVYNCDKLVVVFPFRMFTCVQKLKEVSITNCKGVEVVVSVTGIEESGAVNNQTITFPRLRTLGLTNLENLKTFCGNSTQSEPQPLFEPQVQFPNLGYIYVEGLPNVGNFKQQLAKGEIKFPAIQRLSIDRERWYMDGQPKKEYFDQQLLKTGES